METCAAATTLLAACEQVPALLAWTGRAGLVDAQPACHLELQARGRGCSSSIG